MEDFKHLTNEQVAAYLEGKGNISDLEFLNEMIADPVLDAVLDIVNDISDIDELDELHDLLDDIR